MNNQGNNANLAHLFQQILNHLENKNDPHGHNQQGTERLDDNTMNLFKNIKSEGVSSEDQNYQYYMEYCNIFVANVILLEKVKETIDQKENLIFKLKRLQSSAEQVLSSLSQKNMNRKRRYRRKADEIVRAYKCPIPGCNKSYGTEGSLQQHLKQKHRKYFAKYVANKTKLENEKMMNGEKVDAL